MNDTNLLGKFAIDANLDNLQDIFDIEDALDVIMGGLIEADDVPPDVWIGMKLIRTRLDHVRERTMRIPYAVRTVATETHLVEKPLPLDNVE